ncbi:ABC transporter permease protein [Gottschalkia acidurici 9a]|uniref:ABC transporter permease protein n=1 Tax=Gottschalkia acidurici (strain ATCC 7906 / DSM 604 / BCRC 14475 / CIP 104303 / KCTC 5404 / NCIMB 10678 / 9a) TaxID=1128398 RepID=K0B1Y7_GOTA9|nr:iron ABC transporter permease [Gottschalkia acidurici]AFS78930.1 ABC transporter permease protein [Gottschalkia acidurici 9a]
MAVGLKSEGDSKKNPKYKLKFLILILIPIVAFLLSITLGRYSITIGQAFNILFLKLIELFANLFTKLTGIEINYPSSSNYPNVIHTVIFQVRIPRIVTAMIVGSALSISGAVYQGMFKNPMVSPDILGTSAGAGFGAALAILLSFNTVGIQLMAFTFGLLAVLLTYTISTKVSRGGNIMFVFILAGMLVGTVFQSFISLSKYVADPYEKLPAITFWLMGSLSTISQRDTFMILIPFLLGIVPIFLVRWHLNTLSFGEEEAKALGIDTRRLRFLVIICSTLLTASAVSVSGMIGWVGLIVPHLARMVVGPNFKVLLPASALMGSTYLLMVDNIARSVASIEIPLGILTSLVGAPFFIYLLLNTRKGWS